MLKNRDKILHSKTFMNKQCYKHGVSFYGWVNTALIKTAYLCHLEVITINKQN